MDHFTDDLMESVAGIGFIVFGLVFWVEVSAAVGKIARCKGYNFRNWFLACVVLTPPLAALLVAALPDRHLHRKLDMLMNGQPVSE